MKECAEFQGQKTRKRHGHRSITSRCLLIKQCEPTDVRVQGFATCVAPQIAAKATRSVTDTKASPMEDLSPWIESKRTERGEHARPVLPWGAQGHPGG
eukprot:scaffold53820_cov33-Tisochrysis_lutea.AAC.2